MIRSRRGAVPLRTLLIAAVAALIPAIAGCEAGLNAPTQHWHQPTPGASAVVDKTLRINNMFVLGPAPGFTFRPGGSAGLFFGLSNNGPRDQLVSITAPGAASSVLLPAGGISVERQQSLLLTGPAPQVVLQHLTRFLRGGQYVVVSMDFLNAGHVTLRVPVMPRAAAYATFSPAPVRPSATATPSSRARATPSAAPTS